LTTIDTIELTTSIDHLQDMSKSKFMTSTIKKTNGFEITNHSLNIKPTGIKKVNICETLGTVRIEASSKLLGSNYGQGICINTLDQFIDEVNKSGIELDHHFINDAEVKLIHVKNDLRLTNDTADYINALNQLIAPRFTKTKYVTGVVFKEKIKTHPVFSTFYSKGHELKQNKSFSNQHIGLLDSMENVLRMESKLPKVSTIKKYFESNKLLDILTASNVNHDIFEKVVNNQTNYKTFINISKMTNAEEKNFSQIYFLNEYYGGDFDSIYNHLKSKFSANTKPTGLRKKLIESLSIINNSDSTFNLDNIEEIKNSLKAD
jgi:hypothetical protein